MELWQFLAQEKHKDYKNTHKKFAIAIGVTPVTLSRIVTYKQKPGIPTAKKIQEMSGGQVVWHEILDMCSKEK